jgi:NTE family protein
MALLHLRAMNLLKPKIGLALGGGGARGAAHLGVLKQLEKLAIKPHCLAGTSAGAVVAALYAFGVPLEVMEVEMKKLKPLSYSSFTLRGLGLFENLEVKKLLEKLLPPDALIEKAHLPLAIKATDLLTGRGVSLLHGPVIEAVLASSCVPGIYTPQMVNNMLLVDGGLTENVPLSSLKLLGAHVRIGVNLNGNEGYTKPNGIMDVLSSAMDIAIDAQTRRQLAEAHVVISMDLTQYSRTSSVDYDELILEGMRATKKVIRSQGLLKLWVVIKQIWRFFKRSLPLKLPYTQS